MSVFKRATVDLARDYWISAVDARRRGNRLLMRAHALHARTLEAAACVRPNDDYRRLAAASSAAWAAVRASNTR